MKTYFIGGPDDLSCRVMPDDGRTKFIYTARLHVHGIKWVRGASADPESVSTTVKNRYRRYELPGNNGEMVAICIYDGEE